jgi:alkylation response protein AidB-like acyl-CoA dehydrogenase
MSIPQKRLGQGADHDLFRDAVRIFFKRHLHPNLARWEHDHLVDRKFWNLAGEAGLLCPTVPESYGGPGLDFRYNAIVTEELAYAGSSVSLPLQSDIVADYFVVYGTEEQKQSYLPGMVRGELVSAIAMTEPGAGSDLKAIRTSARMSGGDYIVNGNKTFITNGQHCDFVIVAAKTDPDAGAKGISLLIVDAGAPGFRKGRKLEKIGQHTADTSELFFEDVRVPQERLLGIEGQGFGQLMALFPQERLSQSVMGQASAQRALDETREFVTSRKAFGEVLLDFQNTRFVLANHASKLQVGWAHLDWCIDRQVQGVLTTAEASAAKMWHTEMQWDLIDACLQLHGGAGYMNDTLIARLWRDARAQKIYGGTSEILREVVARSL